MKEQIESILTGLPYRAKPVGPLWQITLGKLGGSRENGISLARDLKAQYLKTKVRGGEGAETERVVYRDNPETEAELTELRKREAARDAEDALMRGLEKLEKTHAEMQERPAEPEPEPEPKPAPEGVTETLLEAGLYQSDTPEKVNEVLLRKLNEAKQCHYIALEHGGTFNGGSSVYWERKAERYQTGVNWNRARMAETLS
jgi:hypothetical protein